MAAVGLVVAVVVIARAFVGWMDRVDDFDRADLPATLEVEITETGGYSIYHETTFPLAPDPQVEVTSPSGDDVPLDRYSGSVTYATSDHEGEGLYTFEATETGVYEVEASGGSLGSGIAVGRGVGDGLVGPILAGVLIGFLSVVAGIVIAIVVGVSRSRNRRALTPAPAVAGWGTPGWGGPQGAPPSPYGPAGYPRSPYGGQAPGGHPPGYPPPPTPVAPAPPPAAPAQPPPPSPQDAPPPRDAAVAPSPPRDAPVAPSPEGPAPPAAGDPAGGVHPMGGPVESRGALDPRRRSPLRPAGAIADPPSLRAPLDWSRGDVPLHWSPRR